jgi:SagB-type dehydrogenase family enzyme
LALGVNSIDLVRLANRLEAELGHRPDLADMFGLRTVRDLAAYYAARHVTPSQPTVLLEPAQREAFKQALRARPATGPTVPLAGAPTPTARESARSFAPEPIPAAALGELLAKLAALPDGKRNFASAGALYAVQTYMLARHVTGLPAGLYAYDPTTHALAAVAPALQLPDLHYARNVALAEHAAFDLFLVAAEADIRPIYGDWWQRFALLEAGAMAQLLADAAPARDLALCPIGHLDFERLRTHLGLEGELLLAHALAGGAPDAWEVLTL